MMASDSDGSDYEDAREHHDNEVDNVRRPHRPVPPTNVIVTSGVLPSSSRHNNQEEQTVREGERTNPENNSEESQQQQESDSAERENDNEPSIQELVSPADDPPNVEELQPGGEDVNVEPEVEENDDVEVDDELDRLLIRRFQDHLNALPRQMVVDSDEDDVDTISDDSDLDFPMLNDGERDRAVSSDENDGQDAELDVHIQDFDQELPIRHSYLGEGMEALQGRVVLEEDATPEIPLVAMGIHLVPGQTLPLTIFHAVFQNAIRRCVMTDRLFGIVHNDMDMPTGNVVYKGALGTLAEIYEYQEESDGDGPGSMSSSFALKAKGRQRFNVLEVRRQADGNLMGRVKIRPEISLEPFVLNILLPSASRSFLPNPKEYENDDEDSTVVASSDPQNRSSRTSSISQISRFTFARRDSISSAVSTFGPDKDLAALKCKISAQRKRLKYYSAMTSHPYFVYEHYDETVLVEKVHRMLKTELKGITESGGKVPVDASDLSFWLAQNLTIDDSHRTKILKMDCAIQRLRYELDLLARTTKVISCRNCQNNIADHSQIFSMSIEGPQGTYVNPHGFVHETLTVYKVKELITRGLASTEASWFPGYSWTIVECKRCKSHIGWKFQAVGRLKPARFWGLARRSVIFKYDFGSDSDLQENLENHRTPPNSANSEAYATVALF